MIGILFIDLLGFYHDALLERVVGLECGNSVFNLGKENLILRVVHFEDIWNAFELELARYQLLFDLNYFDIDAYK